MNVRTDPTVVIWDADTTTSSAPQAYVAAMDYGYLYVWVTDNGDWYYGLEIGHNDYPRSDDWIVTFSVENARADSIADAKFKAARHYDRTQVAEQTISDEMDMLMAADPDNPDPDWWKA